MIERSPTRICNVKVRHLYAAIIAAQYTTPRVFTAHGDADVARHAHVFDHLPEPFRTQAIARAMKCVHHKAVPPEMAEVAYKVAMSAMPFGPNKSGICKRDACPCGSGAAETIEHTFHECARSKRLWEMVLEQWGSVTGETKVKAADARVVIFGERSGQWIDEAEQSDFAGLEEPFAVIHKTTLDVLYQERNKDAAPGARTRRTAMQLYQKVAKLVQMIVTQKWHACKSAQIATRGDGMFRFRRTWEAPGFVTIPPEGAPTLIFFMKEVTRQRWAGKKLDVHAKRFRTQQHAPPLDLPEGTVSIYTDGSAEPRQLGKPPAPAGYGAAAVIGGEGHENQGGKVIFHAHGQITLTTPNIQNVTNNSAELVAFTRALQWAAARPDICHVVMRYDSMYAAMIASGVWKAKKHKLLAAEAQRAWKALKGKLGETVWLRHVKGHSGHEWNNLVDRYADLGRQGEYRYEEAYAVT
jgi:ribonuclease HI